MTMMTCELPPLIALRLAEFCAAAKSGNLQLDINHGEIVAFKLTESARIDKIKQ